MFTSMHTKQRDPDEEMREVGRDLCGHPEKAEETGNRKISKIPPVLKKQVFSNFFN